MQIKYSMLGCRIDLYFHDYKRALEIDENVHSARNTDCERKRRKSIKQKLGYEL